MFEFFQSLYFLIAAIGLSVAAMISVGLVLWGVDLVVTWIYQYWA